MDAPVLTFTSLDDRIEALSVLGPGPVGRERRDRRGVILIVVSGFSMLLLGKTLPPRPWVAVVLAALLLLAFFYWMSVLLINLRFRAELYDTLLKKALTWLAT